MRVLHTPFTYVVWCSLTAELGAHMVARYRELISNPDVVELAGVGHYPQIEAPEAVSANVL